jgi:hypothetical protein
MKYLRIHTAVWFLIVLAFTAVDAALVFIWWVLTFVWNFKGHSYLWNWRETHTYDLFGYAPRFHTCKYTDKNILSTIKRRMSFKKLMGDLGDPVEKYPMDGSHIYDKPYFACLHNENFD